MTDNKKMGNFGERKVRNYLRRRGYVILDKNYLAKCGELDIVARRFNTIAFVEVKTRSSAEYGGPAAALTPAKRRALCRAAGAWLAAHDAWGSPCRFDVVCVLRRGDVLYPEHYRHAFSCEPSVDSGHAAWQPW